MPDLFLRLQSDQGVMLTAQLHLVPRLKMNETVLLFPLYAFVAS
jgi:hypothetical protein